MFLKAKLEEKTELFPPCALPITDSSNSLLHKCRGQNGLLPSISLSCFFHLENVLQGVIMPYKTIRVFCVYKSRGQNRLNLYTTLCELVLETESVGT